MNSWRHILEIVLWAGGVIEHFGGHMVGLKTKYGVYHRKERNQKYEKFNNIHLLMTSSEQRSEIVRMLIEHSENYTLTRVSTVSRFPFRKGIMGSNRTPDTESVLYQYCGRKWEITDRHREE